MEVKVSNIRVRQDSRWTNHPKKVRVYPWLKDSGALNDLASGERYNKPSKAIRKATDSVFGDEVSLIAHINKMLGYPEDTRWGWSQKAGCSMCPCSPGFVIDHDPIGEQRYHEVSVHVDYEYVEEAK